MDFGEALGQIFKIAHPEGNGSQIERVVSERQTLAVGPLEKYLLFEAFFPDLFPAEVHHFFRKIHGIDALGSEFFGQHDRLVACSGGDVQDPASARRLGDFYQFFPPQYVDAPGEEVVQEIVVPGDTIEHLAHLLGLAAGRARIGGDGGHGKMRFSGFVPAKVRIPGVLAAMLGVGNVFFLALDVFLRNIPVFFDRRNAKISTRSDEDPCKMTTLVWRKSAENKRHESPLRSR